MSLIVIDILMEYDRGWRSFDASDAIRRTTLVRLLRAHALTPIVGNLAGRAFNAARFQWWSEPSTRFSGEITLLAGLLCP